MSTGRRIPGIDLLRGVSILLVLIHHFAIGYRLGDTALGTLLTPTLLHAVTRNGNYGVVMFFAVSGYLITDNAHRRWGAPARISIPGFYRLRAARILPGLLLLLALVELLALAGLPIFARNQAESGAPVSPLLVNLSVLTLTVPLLLARFGWANYALCVCWSLSVEEAFYLAFPVACRVLRHPAALATFCAAFIVAGPIWRSFHADDEAGFLYAYLACFDAIAIGACAALLAERFPLLPARLRPLRWPAVAVMAALYLSASIGDTAVWGVPLMALGAAILVLAASARPAAAAPRSPAPFRALQALGRLSYELYLFHLLVLGLIRTVVPPAPTLGDRALPLLALFLLGSALLAALISRCWTEPNNRRLRGIHPRHAGATPLATGASAVTGEA